MGLGGMCLAATEKFGRVSESTCLLVQTVGFLPIERSQFHSVCRGPHLLSGFRSLHLPASLLIRTRNPRSFPRPQDNETMRKHVKRLATTTCSPLLTTGALHSETAFQNEGKTTRKQLSSRATVCIRNRRGISRLRVEDTFKRNGLSALQSRRHREDRVCEIPP